MKSKNITIGNHSFLVQKVPALRAEKIFLPVILSMEQGQGNASDAGKIKDLMVNNADSFEKLLKYCFFATPEGGHTPITEELCDAQDINFMSITELKIKCFEFNIGFLGIGTQTTTQP